MKRWIVLRIFPETQYNGVEWPEMMKRWASNGAEKNIWPCEYWGTPSHPRKCRTILGNSVNWVMDGVFFPVAVQFCVSSVFGKEGASADRVGVTVPFRTAAFVRMFHDFSQVMESHAFLCFACYIIWYGKVSRSLSIFPEMRLWNTLVLSKPWALCTFQQMDEGKPWGFLGQSLLLPSFPSP